MGTITWTTVKAGMGVDNLIGQQILGGDMNVSMPNAYKDLGIALNAMGFRNSVGMPFTVYNTPPSGYRQEFDHEVTNGLRAFRKKMMMPTDTGLLTKSFYNLVLTKPTSVVWNIAKQSYTDEVGPYIYTTNYNGIVKKNIGYTLIELTKEYKYFYYVRKSLNAMGFGGVDGRPLNNPEPTYKDTIQRVSEYRPDLWGMGGDFVTVDKVVTITTYADLPWSANDQHAVKLFKTQHGIRNAGDGMLKIFNNVVSTFIVKVLEKDFSLLKPHRDSNLSPYELAYMKELYIGSGGTFDRYTRDIVQLIFIGAYHAGRYDYDGETYIKPDPVPYVSGGFMPEIAPPLVIVEEEPADKNFADSEVMQIQKKLNEIGIGDALDRALTENGIWSNDYMSAIKKFQNKNGIEVTGEVDVDTLIKLNEVYSKLNSTVLVNVKALPPITPPIVVPAYVPPEPVVVPVPVPIFKPEPVVDIKPEKVIETIANNNAPKFVDASKTESSKMKKNIGIVAGILGVLYYGNME